MSKLFNLVIVILLLGHSVFSQEVKFGKVSKEELQEKIYAKDSTADAAVLFRNVSVSFNYIESEGFVIQKRVHERIKIYNKGGFTFGTVEESLYQGSNGTRETISKLKAYTYNLVGGEIEKIKLKSSDTFSEETSKYNTKEKFTMPNLKEGSVIEYQYVINSPYYSSFNEVTLQYDIPIKAQEIKVAIPEYFSFKNTSKGHLLYKIEKSSRSGSITFNNKTRSSTGPRGGVSKTNFSTSKLDFTVHVSAVNMSDVPALKEEVYVNSMENYRSAIKYELQYTKFPNSLLKNYSVSWENVVKKIYENDEFGKQLNTSKYYREDLAKIVTGKATEKEKTNAIYNYVQSRMSWNGIYGYYTDEGVKKAYDLKTGNVADINLMLVSMLRSSGLKANPVLVSTRSNGVPLFPTRYGFNYVVAVVNIEGNNFFLDATSNYSKANMLPIRTLNWAGRIVLEGGASTSISLIPDYLSSESVMMNVNVLETGSIDGKVRRACKDYIAYRFRTQNLDIDEDTYLEKLEEKYNGIEIEEYTVKNKKEVGKPVLESFSFNQELGTEVIGDKIYVSPLFWFKQATNPFKLETRNYPVDFAYPWQDRHIITINVPEGYKVETLPKSVNMALGDGVSSFLFQIAESIPGKIQVKSELKMNQAIIVPQDYQGLKDFYKAVVEKQIEKVVLSKI